ncbi:MAG: hypothetical protein CMM78_11575 [Rhodospirillaceae bacterium]|jgi:hypothetical protein|uniref:DUF7660 family protein n=1 Tax=unclassified Hwanghaeella TaxID=2605944 RepID=UPI000C5EC852|nr:hypothetical protein [Rhodospirillales bacterium]MAX48841.1 hypothetical protein [Rhodospirillaceae bacterium]|tara:strand:+ start:213 stop:497 length:285 start_codon:yes stop_codon:yes gene_type:complete
MNEEDRLALSSKFQKQQEAVSNHEELSDFLADLLEAYDEGFFEEQSVTDYLGGMVALLAAMNSWARNVGYGPGAPEQPDWRWMARLLRAAFHHS